MTANENKKKTKVDTGTKKGTVTEYMDDFGGVY
jgi:hypothetical protein